MAFLYLVDGVRVSRTQVLRTIMIAYDCSKQDAMDMLETRESINVQPSNMDGTLQPSGDRRVSELQYQSKRELKQEDRARTRFNPAWQPRDAK